MTRIFPLSFLQFSQSLQSVWMSFLILENLWFLSVMTAIPPPTVKICCFLTGLGHCYQIIHKQQINQFISCLFAVAQLHTCVQKCKVICFYLGLLQCLQTTSGKGVATPPPLPWQQDAALHLRDTAKGAKGLNILPRFTQETLVNWIWMPWHSPATELVLTGERKFPPQNQCHHSDGGCHQNSLHVYSSPLGLMESKHSWTPGAGGFTRWPGCATTALPHALALQCCPPGAVVLAQIRTCCRGWLTPTNCEQYC